MQCDFRRVAIVNRGEAAMRFIHAAREFDQEYGTSLCTIALFTEPDRRAMFVREADEAIPLGAAQIIDPATHQARSTYLEYDRLEQALVQARADAAWVGWGFVAEHAAFADLCRRLGIVFIGPDGGVMRLLGDKISSKLLAERAQVAVAPWSGCAVDSLVDAYCHAERLGYPLLIKATAGGGGHGIRCVHSREELATAFERARAEAAAAFGDPTVFMEQMIAGARHVEVQIIADRYANTWAAGVRDCSIQRRHQKILEEAPSPALSPEQHQELCDAAVRLSRAAGYCNAGTVEFLYEPQSRRFLFMEVNTRLQVEHPVTECTTGLDLVKLQILVARGERLEGKPPRTRGHAIEVRVNAEDPDNFSPAPGTIERFRILAGPGVRVDTGVAEGDTVAPEFDSMIAKIIAYGRDRREALSRLQRTLRESVVVVNGGASNKPFLLGLLNRPEVQRGEVDVGWLGRLAANGEYFGGPYADVALIQAAIETYAADSNLEQAQFYTSAVRGRPQVRSEVGRSVALRYRGQSYLLKVYRMGLQRYRVEVDRARIDIQTERLGKFEYWLTISGRRFRVVSVPQTLSYRVEVEGFAHRIERDEGGVVHSPIPAVVVSIAVKPGDTVAAGDRLAVLEAMKMETQVVAPCAGRVRQIMTIPYVQVNTGDPLVGIEPTAERELQSGGERVAFNSTDSECAQELEEVRQLMLGFDANPALVPKLISQDQKVSAQVSAEKQGAKLGQQRLLEDEILSVFVDICSLFKHEPERDDSVGGEAPSSESYLFSYLRMLETRGEGLPPAFVDALQRALDHYGVRTLDRTPELEESLFRIYKSHQRMEEQIAPILALLERRLELADETAQPKQFRELLDRMISITRDLFPSISDMAREVGYRCFDQPLFERVRKQVYAEVENHLAALAIDPLSNSRAQRVQAMVECPQPLVSLLAPRFAHANDPMRQLMLEVLTLRYYRIRQLMNVRSLRLHGHCYAAAEYDYEGKRIHVFTTHTDYGRLTEAAIGMAPLIQNVSAEHDIVLDFYAWHDGSMGDPERMQQGVCSMLNRCGFSRPLRRIVVALASPGRGQGMGGMQHFTYRWREQSYQEEKLYRGLHPMMAKRLYLWQLANFRVDRLPSVEDVYLFRGVARENPKDERLFAFAEVRDVTPVRDEAGRIVQLPHLERMLSEALAGMRLFQSRRAAHERLHWNRILLYVWPPLSLKREEFHRILHRLTSAIEGAGLQEVVVRARIPHSETGDLRDVEVHITSPGGTGLLITFQPADQLEPLKALAEYDQKVVRMRQRGLVYPYEIIRMLAPGLQETAADFPPGDFTEHDLDANGCMVPVRRPYGQNKTNIIVGVIRNVTDKYPEGMTRVMVLGDPSRDLGSLAEPECRQIIAALDLAENKNVPLEWFAISAGAKISMESGVENMDWIARVLRRLVEFTQAGGEVNLVVNGINVGAQPYWNAEATMLMHTRGILIMTPKAAMVLTGKRALEFSGSVSAEDNQGIGGYDRIMGLNGQAQYWARDIDEACHILLRHYEHTYVAPGERFPRSAITGDPIDRDVRAYPHGKGREDSFALVGEVFSDATNPARKKSFDIRRVMMAVIDQDHAPLERWSGMRAAETAVVWDAHLGGFPVCLIGIESRPLARLGFVPADGPDQWTAGTLFPLSSKKVARAINAASNNRPVVLLANLSGFDGSPESMRRLQLEYGAEIGRAVVNFEGPMVFCVISRYHGGAYVVFSQVLNENLEVAALEGTYASVIGGAPAAAVVFAGEVQSRTRKDPRLQALNQAISQADGVEKARLSVQWDELFKVIHCEKLSEMADEFDRVHSVQRALTVGALHQIIPAANLRPYLVHAVARGRAREEQGAPQKTKPRVSMRKAA